MKMICFGIANEQILSMFDRVICPGNMLMDGYYSLMFSFNFFSENRISHCIQIVSQGDNLHDMSNHLLGKWEKCFKMLSAY